MVRNKESRNVLDMIPVRRYEWEENDTVTVKVPRFKSIPGKGFGKLVKSTPTYNVNLDARGSAAWKLCDGERTVRDIVHAMKERFTDDVEPAVERVTELMNIMESNGLIIYKKVNSDSVKKGGT